MDAVFEAEASIDLERQRPAIERPYRLVEAVQKNRQRDAIVDEDAHDVVGKIERTLHILLEVDLDQYMIVAVSDFNMGAMENKGLNVFNTRYVLARPDTATDIDYQNIDRVVAHEYFHNWTGNRVTCRDWFQLSLKEGLTVFRDQEFGADMYSR